MTKKFHILVLILTLGFFLIPAVTYACKTESGKACCNKEMASSETKKMDCCKKDNHSKKSKENESCGGKSKHSSCSCSIFHISVILPLETEEKILSFNFFDGKNKFNDTETSLSSGFYSGSGCFGMSGSDNFIYGIKWQSPVCGSYR